MRRRFPRQGRREIELSQATPDDAGYVALKVRGKRRERSTATIAHEPLDFRAQICKRDRQGHFTASFGWRVRRSREDCFDVNCSGCRRCDQHAFRRPCARSLGAQIHDERNCAWRVPSSSVRCCGTWRSQGSFRFPIQRVLA